MPNSAKYLPTICLLALFTLHTRAENMEVSSLEAAAFIVIKHEATSNHYLRSQASVYLTVFGTDPSPNMVLHLAELEVAVLPGSTYEKAESPQTIEALRIPIVVDVMGSPSHDEVTLSYLAGSSGNVYETSYVLELHDGTWVIVEQGRIRMQ